MINELYDFGLFLVRNVVADVERVDKKAAALAAYSGAIITLLISTFNLWFHIVNRWIFPMLFLAGLLTMGAAVYSVYGLSLREFRWFSQKEWLEDVRAFDAIRLKKYRILTMWDVISEYRRNHLIKAERLAKAQKYLSLAVLSLVLAFLLASAAAFFEYTPLWFKRG